MSRERWPWVLLAVVVLAVELPLCAVEGLYRVALRSAGELPRLPQQPHVARVQRALWAAEEDGPPAVEPLTPPAIVAQLVRGGREPLGGGRLAAGLAKRFCLGAAHDQTGLSRLRCEVSVAIRLTRHASAAQLADGSAARLYFGRGAYGAGEAARRWFGAGPDELTWAQAAMLVALARTGAESAVQARPSCRGPEPGVAAASRAVGAH